MAPIAGVSASFTITDDMAENDMSTIRQRFDRAHVYQQGRLIAELYDGEWVESDNVDLNDLVEEVTRYNQPTTTVEARVVVPHRGCEEHVRELLLGLNVRRSISEPVDRDVILSMVNPAGASIVKARLTEADMQERPGGFYGRVSFMGGRTNREPTITPENRTLRTPNEALHTHPLLHRLYVVAFHSALEDGSVPPPSEHYLTGALLAEFADDHVGLEMLRDTLGGRVSGEEGKTITPVAAMRAEWHVLVDGEWQPDKTVRPVFVEDPAWRAALKYGALLRNWHSEEVATHRAPVERIYEDARRVAEAATMTTATAADLDAVGMRWPRGGDSP